MCEHLLPPDNYWNQEALRAIRGQYSIGGITRCMRCGELLHALYIYTDETEKETALAYSTLTQEEKLTLLIEYEDIPWLQESQYQKIMQCLSKLQKTH